MAQDSESVLIYRFPSFLRGNSNSKSGVTHETNLGPLAMNITYFLHKVTTLVLKELIQIAVSIRFKTSNSLSYLSVLNCSLSEFFTGLFQSR